MKLLTPDQIRELPNYEAKAKAWTAREERLKEFAPQLLASLEAILDLAVPCASEGNDDIEIINNAKLIIKKARGMQ